MCSFLESFANFTHVNIFFESLAIFDIIFLFICKTRSSFESLNYIAWSLWLFWWCLFIAFIITFHFVWGFHIFLNVTNIKIVNVILDFKCIWHWLVTSTKVWKFCDYNGNHKSFHLILKETNLFGLRISRIKTYPT